MEATKSNKKRNVILEFVFLLILPLCVFLYFFVRNKNALEQMPLESNTTEQSTTLEKENQLIDQGLSFLNQKQYAKSIEVNQKVIAINPNNKIAYNNIGIAYANLKNWDQGIDYCRKALKIDPEFQLAKNNLAWMLSEKGD